MFNLKFSISGGNDWLKAIQAISDVVKQTEKYHPNVPINVEVTFLN